MTRSRTERLHALFVEALAHEPASRSAFIARACPDDAALRREVAALLASAESAPPEFLVPPPPPPPPTPSALDEAVAGDPRPDRPPRRRAGDSSNAAIDERRSAPAAPDPLADQLIGRSVGSYQITRLIAGGGMGIVFEAVQAQPRRTVALKLIRPQYASTSAVRRFRLEAEVLGRLRHPGIAQVYEFGVADTPLGATPFFAMEFVPEALPLTRFADAAGLSTRQRLELFAEVCDAVQHGHMNGVIHRDLKPGNILVGQEGQAGTEPGRHEGIRLGRTRRHEVTEPGRHEGTEARRHEAMSREPVVAAARGPSPPLRACVPSCLRAYPKVIDFGVARVDGGEAGLTTAHTMTGQIIGTVQYMSPEQCDGDPNAVDVRSDVYSLGVILYELLTGTLPYHATSLSLVAATRAIREQEPARPSTINRKLRGDVETVVLKALEKDRTRRYQSAEALARDIRHVLNREPIEARRATMLERAVKWAVRHPVVVTLAACGLLLIASLGLAGLLYWGAAIRPHKAVIRGNGEVAELVTVTGYEVHSWVAQMPGGIRFARLVPRAEALGGGRVALIGYGASEAHEPRSQFAVFDEQRGWDKPQVKIRLTDENIPLAEIERRRARLGSESRHSFRGQDFGAMQAIVADVFDDPDTPGSELIAVFQHPSVTHAAICVYRLDGTPLYRVWIEADIRALYWMAALRLLVVAGVNGEAHCHERVNSTAHESLRSHPTVVFALQPSRIVTTDFVAQEPRLRASSPPHARPVWYYAVSPFLASYRYSDPVLSGPYGAPDATDWVGFGVILDSPFVKAGTRGWSINGRSGRIVDCPLGDGYRNHSYAHGEPPNQERPFPPFESWKLVELPPMEPNVFANMFVTPVDDRSDP